MDAANLLEYIPLERLAAMESDTPLDIVARHLVSLLLNFAVLVTTLAACAVLLILCLVWLLLFQVQIVLLEQTARLLRTCMTEPVLLSEAATERTSARQAPHPEHDQSVSDTHQTPTTKAVSSTAHSASIPPPPLVESSRNADTSASSHAVSKQVEPKLKINPFANNVAGLAEAKSFSADMKTPKNWGRTTPQTASSHKQQVTNVPIAPQKKLGDAPTNIPARTSTGNSAIPPHMRMLMAAKEAKQVTASAKQNVTGTAPTETRKILKELNNRDPDDERRSSSTSDHSVTPQGTAAKIVANGPSISRGQERHTATMVNHPLQQHASAKSGQNAAHQQQWPAIQPASTHVPYIFEGVQVADPMQVPISTGFGIDNRETMRAPYRPTSSELSPTAQAFFVPLKPSSEGMFSAREVSGAVQAVTSTRLSRPPQTDSRIANLPSPDLMAYRIAAGSSSLPPAPHSLHKLLQPPYDVAPTIGEVPIARRASRAVPITKPATPISASTDPSANPKLARTAQKNVAISWPPGLGPPQKNVQADFDALIDLSEALDYGQQEQNIDPQRQLSASFKASPMRVLKPETRAQGAHHAQSDQKSTADVAQLKDSANIFADDASALIVFNEENAPPTVAPKQEVQAHDELSTRSDQDSVEEIPTPDDPKSASPDEASPSAVPNKTKSEIKEMKKNARIALTDAWFEREEVRKKVTSDYKLEDMMQLQDLTNTYSQRRQSLQDLMGNGVLNVDDDKVFPVIGARNLEKPQLQPQGFVEWRERRHLSKIDAKTTDEASHDGDGELDETSKLIDKMEGAKTLHQNSLDYFKQPRPYTNSGYLVWKQKGEAAKVRATKFYAVKLRALKAQFPQGMPPDLLEKYPELP